MTIVFDTHREEITYWRRQVWNPNRGAWMDLTPEYYTEREGIEAAKQLSREEDVRVRLVEYSYWRDREQNEA